MESVASSCYDVDFVVESLAAGVGQVVFEVVLYPVHVLVQGFYE